MSNLWDLKYIQPQTEVVLEGDTIPTMFWNAVERRGPNEIVFPNCSEFPSPLKRCTTR